MESAECVSWDFEALGKSFLSQKQSQLTLFLLDGIGGWTNRGCITLLEKASRRLMCKCNHLTNFAALVVSNCFITILIQR